MRILPRPERVSPSRSFVTRSLVAGLALALSAAAFPADRHGHVETAAVDLGPGLAPAIPALPSTLPPLTDDFSTTDFHLDASTVERLRIGDVLALPSASQGSVRMRVTSTGGSGRGSRIVRFAGDADLLSSPFANATIILHDGLVGGFVRPRDGFEIALAALGPGHQEIRVKPESDGDCCGVGNEPPQMEEGGIAADCQESPKVVDVMFVFTPAAAAFWGGTEPLTLLLEAALDDTNSALKNSGLLTRLRLVEVLGPYGGAGQMETASGALSTTSGILNAIHNGGPTIGEQTWQALSTAPALYGADLCQAIAAVPAGASCGTADQFTGNPSKCFSVVSVSCLGDYVPAHEFGHGFGACHAIGDGLGCDGGGYYPFSNGWRFVGASGQVWRTIMAFAPGTRIPYYSTPGTLFDGKPIGAAGNGYSGADNARTLGLTASSVANFRCTIDPLVDCNGNGEADSVDILDGTSEDCNGNAVPDECDIASGFLTDVNGNGIPDQCEVGATKIVSPDAPGQPVILDAFGFSVAVGHRLDQIVETNGYLVSGAYGDDQGANNSGAAYLIDLSGSTPINVEKFKASDPTTNANFGRGVAAFKRVAQTTPVASARSFAAIGAYRAPNGSIAEQGATYVFAKTDPSPWAQVLKLKAGDGQANDWFGFSQAMGRIGVDNFETLVSGAPRASGNKGAVYVYRYQLNDTTLLSKKLVLPLAGDGDQFGWSVAMDENAGDRAILIAGAPGFSQNLGRVRAFERPLTANANFSSTGPLLTLDPSEALPGDRFGEAVALTDNVAVIGAPGKDSGRGAAYYFERTSANNWIQRQKLQLPSPALDDRFGAAVSLLRRTDGAVILLVAAPRADAVTPSGPQTNVGVIATYKLDTSSNQFVLQSVSVVPDGQTGDESGTCLAQLQTAAGLATFAAIGMPFDDDAGLNSGSLYLTPLLVP
ncbi:MAG: hypothetical protein U0572_16995 [Phycisphaerales bacterium]